MRDTLGDSLKRKGAAASAAVSDRCLEERSLSTVSFFDSSGCSSPWSASLSTTFFDWPNAHRKVLLRNHLLLCCLVKAKKKSIFDDSWDDSFVLLSFLFLFSSSAIINRNAYDPQMDSDTRLRFWFRQLMASVHWSICECISVCVCFSFAYFMYSGRLFLLAQLFAQAKCAMNILSLNLPGATTHSSDRNDSLFSRSRLHASVHV